MNIKKQKNYQSEFHYYVGTAAFCLCIFTLGKICVAEVQVQRSVWET